MQILRMVEGSVLWLLIPAASSQDHLRALATQQEVAPDRLVFAKRQNNPDHLARYPLADLILDSFPYGAHTTASDALWMGVPVLTMVGSSFASRVCGSLLQAAGLPELICDSVQDYLDRAIEIGRDPARRAALRQRLEAEREGCLLFDTPLLVRALEDLYRQMWDDYCRGERPQPDLSNLALYQEIGVDLAGAPPPADYHGEYRRRLAGRQSYNFVSPDPRVWPGRR